MPPVIDMYLIENYLFLKKGWAIFSCSESTFFVFRKNVQPPEDAGCNVSPSQTKPKGEMASYINLINNIKYSWSWRHSLGNIISNAFFHSVSFYEIKAY